MANGAALKAGTVQDFEGSMAEAMASALGEQLRIVKGMDLPDGESREMLHMILSAIAQGVVRHLFENPGAFRVSITVQQDDSEAEPILSENAEEVQLVSSSGQWVIPPGAITVRQDSAAVESTGEDGTVEEIAVVGELYGAGP